MVRNHGAHPCDVPDGGLGSHEEEPCAEEHHRCGGDDCVRPAVPVHAEHEEQHDDRHCRGGHHGHEEPRPTPVDVVDGVRVEVHDDVHHD